MKKGSAATAGRKILCHGVGGVSMGLVVLGLWLVAAGFRGVGALVVGWFLSFGSGFAGSAGRLWAFLAAVSPFSAVVPFFWVGRAFGSRFFRFCRGAAGLGFSLSFSLVGRRKKGGAVLPGGGCVPPSWRGGLRGGGGGRGAFAAAGGSFFGARGFLRGARVPLGFRFPLADLTGWRFFLLGRRARAWFLSFGLVVVAALGGRKAPPPRPPPPPLRSRVVGCWRPPLLCRGFVGWVWAVPASNETFKIQLLQK